MADRPYDYDPVGVGSVNQQSYRMEAGQPWRQYAIAAIANLAIICTGYAMGWTSPITAKLKDPSSPVGIVGDNDMSWVGSLLTVGAIFGPFAGGFLSTSVGRKWGLLASAVPLFAGWILVAAARSVGLIYAGRICWGLATGMIFTLSPMYCAEIATDDTRGALGSFLQLFITFGFLLVYAIGPFVSYGVISYVGVAVVAAFCVTFFFMPESPFYHLSKGNKDAAAQALATIRGKSTKGVQAELDLMEADVKASQEKTATMSDLVTGSNFKALYISCCLIFFQQFSGINAVLFYMEDIFTAAGTKLDPSIATIIIGIVQMVASGITPLVVDRLGRKILLMVSSCGTAVGLALLGAFFALPEGSSIRETVNFIPILALVVFILTYCWGLGPLPWAVMSELLPMEVKAKAAPIATAFCWILSFLVTKFFQPISIVIGMHFAFWIFGICCVVSFFFTVFLVPETKGKSFQEIQDILKGNKSSNSK